jgi:hypothetical protein
VISEQFLSLNFGGKTIILRVVSVNLQRDRIEFGLERFEMEGCTIIGFVLQRSSDYIYIPDLKYINHEGRTCYGRFKEFSHEFS